MYDLNELKLANIQATKVNNYVSNEKPIRAELNVRLENFNLRLEIFYDPKS